MRCTGGRTQGKYPSLTKNMLVDGMVCNKAQDEDAEGGPDAEGDDAATDATVFFHGSLSLWM